jgi:metal-responsive CopG/Arc/MetJ family transcriptional regulator
VGRPRKSYEEKKHTVTVSLPGWLIIELEKYGNRSKLIETLLKEFFGKKGK